MPDITPSQQIIRDCESAIRAQQSDFKRSFEIWDAYFAIDGGQWETRKKLDLREQDRYLWQFDVLGPKLETLAGSLAAELPDIDWLPVEGERMQNMEAVREQYYADKEFFNFEDTLLYTIRDGCVHSGWCQLRESKRISETGNIALERCRPSYIIPDPYWVTDNDRDLECLFKIGYFLPEQIAQIYPKKGDEILRAAKERRGKGIRYENDLTNDRRDTEQRNYKSEVGDQFRVIEKFYTKEIVTERLIGIKADLETGQMNHIAFPVTRDRAMLQKFAEVNGLSWDDVTASEYRQKKQFIKTVTDLDPEVVLEDGETREQVNGLSFYHFTCQRYNGHDKGAAEAILDTQRVINEKESYLLEYMAKAGGGSELWNEDLFRNKEQKERFKRNKNKFGHLEFADLDAVKVPRIAVDPAQVPNAVFAEIQRMYDKTLPLVSRVSDAMSAISASEDTGVLYERKYQTNRIANIILEKYVKTLISNIGEGYYYQFQITYGDTQQEIRRRTGGTIAINQKDTINGQAVMINDVSSLPRSKIVVTESKSNPIYQLRKKMEVSEVIKAIPPNDNLRLQAALGMYFENMSMNDETRAKMEMVNELEMQKAMLATMAEMTGYETQIKNNQVMGEQLSMSMAKMEAMQTPPQQPQQAISPEVQNVGAPSAPSAGMPPTAQPPEEQPAEMQMAGAV